MHDLIANLPLPSEIVYHLIVPYIPFVELTSEKYTSASADETMVSNSRILNICDISVRRDMLENLQQFRCIRICV